MVGSAHGVDPGGTVVDASRGVDDGGEHEADVAAAIIRARIDTFFIFTRLYVVVVHVTAPALVLVCMGRLHVGIDGVQPPPIFISLRANYPRTHHRPFHPTRVRTSFED